MRIRLPDDAGGTTEPWKRAKHGNENNWIMQLNQRSPSTTSPPAESNTLWEFVAATYTTHTDTNCTALRLITLQHEIATLHEQSAPISHDLHMLHRLLCKMNGVRANP